MLPVRVLGDVYFAGLPRCLGSAGQIHGVSKQAVTGHTMPNYTGDDLPAVDPDGDFLRGNDHVS